MHVGFSGNRLRFAVGSGIASNAGLSKPRLLLFFVRVSSNFCGISISVLKKKKEKKEEVI
jgi:hypothetical protein